MLFRDAHQSGKFSASRRQWRGCAAGVAEHADVAAFTEAKRLRAPKGWHKHPEANEQEIVWNPDVFEALDHGKEFLRLPSFRHGHRHRTFMGLTWMLLRHRATGLRLLRVAAHFPAHVQHGDHYRLDAAHRQWVDAHRAAMREVGPTLLRLVHRLDPDETTFSADFNVDLRRKAWVKRVEAAFPGMRLVIPPAATHAGGRKIDAFLTTLPVEDSAMLPRYPGMDHRGWAVTQPAEHTGEEPAGQAEEPPAAHHHHHHHHGHSQPGSTQDGGDLVGDIPFIEGPNSGGTYDKNLLVVHVTISPEVKGAARGVIAFWRRGRTGSTQYVVDADEIVQAVPERAYAWAAGTHANKRGIHVELCGFIQSVRQWHDGYSTAELDRAARLFAELATKYDIPIRKIGPAQIRKAYDTGRPEDGGICGHVDITHTWPGDTTHTDPGRFFPWDEFLRLVRKYATDPRAHAPSEPTDEKDWFDMATKDDLRAVVNEELDKRLGHADIITALHDKGAKDDETKSLAGVLRTILRALHRIEAAVTKDTEGA